MADSSFVLAWRRFAPEAYPRMQKSHYEIALEKAQAEVKDALIKLPVDDAHLIARHAKLLGMHVGLEQAASLYRQSARRDAEEDLA